MNQLLLATRNRDKARELQAMLQPLGVTVLTLHDVTSVGDIVEDAPTLEGNAQKKALQAFRQSGLPSLGDDTGLEVGYLGGAPGVFSSRYAGPGATYADNVRKLLRELRGVPPRRRGARFRCVLAFVPAEGVMEIAEGISSGLLLEAPQGTGGFGYDPVFQPDGYTQTFAQMDLAVKNSISHRGRALAAMVEILRRHIGG